jgi:dihydrodipicolinate synthase/N-acetylneuraminate lyase
LESWGLSTFQHSNTSILQYSNISMSDNTQNSLSKQHHGVVVPIVTPLTPQGDLDESGVRRVIDHIVEGGIDGIFVLGTTGEMASLSDSIRSRLIAITAEHTGNRAQTYAGISDNCLARSVAAAEEYFSSGIGAVVAHPPFFYPLNSEELFDYYTTLSERIIGPLIIYNMPKTTHISIPLEVVERLSVNPKIIGLKDSENDIARLEHALTLFRDREDFVFFVGAAVLSSRALRLGGDGFIPSSGNLVPHLCHRLYQNALAEDWEKVEKFQQQIDQVAAVYQQKRSLGQSLAALKSLMSGEGLCEPTVLPPLRTLSMTEQSQLQQAFRALACYS